MKPPTESLPGYHSKKASFSLDGKSMPLSIFISIL